MKKVLTILMGMFFPTLLWYVGAENYDPVANPDAIVHSGNMRFTVLTPEMIRIEWSEQQEFEDRASFTVINRNLPVPQFTTDESEGYLYISTNALTLRYKIGSHPFTDPISSSNLRITFDLNGKEVIWYPGKKDNLNLKGTMRTLDNVQGGDRREEMENGILSRSGWALIDENELRGDGSISHMFDDAEDIPWVETRKDVNSIDWYFLAYGHDYKKALSDFTKISGKIPMPPVYIFGYWYSKFEKYTQQDFMDIVNEVSEYNIPLDIMVIDMDWHLEGWTGWTWNKELIPDPAGLLDWLHEEELKVTLNLHPAAGIGTHEDNFLELANELGLPTDQTVEWNIENKNFYKAFFKYIMRPHENIGVDFWWLDWQQDLLSFHIDKLSQTFWINHVFFHDMELYRPDRRPVIFHRWGGLGNHRYPIGFSGDTYSDYPSLAFQPYFTATASNVGYGYWSHDLGGHQQRAGNDPELYLRWIQYGIFSPVVRTHSADFDNIERRIWKYPNFPLMLDAIKLRYSLIPYIYTYARHAYDEGVSLCRPLYYDYPEVNEAYKYDYQYMFGNEILVAPIVEAADEKSGLSTKNIWLPEGNWYEVVTGEILEGDKVYTRTFTQADIPYYYKEGAIIPNYPDVMHLKERPDKLILNFIPGEYGSFSYYEDENDNSNYKEGKHTFTLIEQFNEELKGTYIIHPVEGHFEGMPEKRKYELRLLARTLPEEVKVNGVIYNNTINGSGYWSYDAGNSTVIIEIPEQTCDSKVEVTVEFSETTGMEAITSGKAMRFSFNSSTQQIEIIFNEAMQNVSLDIYDINGVKVFSGQYKDTQVVNENLSACKLNGKIYFCRISSDAGTVVKKISL